MINDQQSENALLSNIINYGFDSYHQISPIGVSSDTFTVSANQIIYKCLEYLFEKCDAKQIDTPLLINAGKSLGYDKWITSEPTTEYINDLKQEETKLENGLVFAKKIKKLEVARNIHKAVTALQEQVSDITGEESISEIFGMVENKLSHLSGFLTNSSEEPLNISKEIQNHVDKLITAPSDQMGLPSGFPIFDKCIGGGLRRHAITVIGARPKVGKSTFCKNVGYNVAKLGLPVLYFDTEMQTEDQINRMLSSVSSVRLDEIETGAFSFNHVNKQKVSDAVEDIKNINFSHKNISGLSVDAQLAIARKWIIKNVGLNKDGTAKDCLFVYDYIKMMDSAELSKGMQEYQALGFLMTTLQNFAVKYDIPILTAVQLNRDGISTEDTSVIGGSDRIAMYGSSISLLKMKSDEEMEAENYQWGNQKLVPLISRYGEQLEFGNFINIVFDKKLNKMTENGTRSQSQCYKPTSTNYKNTKGRAKKSESQEPQEDLDNGMVEF